MRNRNTNIEIGHYRGSRYWGVWINSELLAVVCYRKGTEAIKTALMDRRPNTKSLRRPLENGEG